MPNDRICRNCGSQTIGSYCHECGQNIYEDQGQPVYQLVPKYISKVFSIDGRTSRTIGNLLWRPGYLTKKYHEGKIVAYIHPVKLFWITTLIFFALFVSQIRQLETTASYESETGERIENTQSNIHLTIAHQPTTPEEIAAFLSTYGPFAVFMLIPIFAVLLVLFFWKNRL